jgi:hypothetical protein
MFTFIVEDSQPFVSLDCKVYDAELKLLNVPLDCQSPPFILNWYDPLPPPAVTVILPLLPSKQVGAEDDDNETVTAVGCVTDTDVLPTSP